ncbi:ankyrin-1-like [Oppia nitens]|uniref:ankyrin-1-like n=1 Tax=Oppia nitens TaxID=1686743 RepID=UPI0023DB0BD5|nr:ankyrin-1-like [Oppia nitens]
MTEQQILFQSIKDNDYKKLEEMLTNGSDMSVINDDGLTLLHLAAELGQQQCVHTLLSYNCIDVNVRDNCDTPLGPLQTTPLHVAAAEGWPQLVIELIDNGADVNSVTITGWTPLQYVMITEKMTPTKLQSMAVLIGKGADVNKRDADGNHSLNIAVLYGHYEATRLLLNSGVQLTAVEAIDPNCLRSDNVYRCVELCVKAGAHRVIEKYHIMRFAMESQETNDEDMDQRQLESIIARMDSLLAVWSSVAPLKHLCRLAYRRLYSGHNFNAVVDCLRIPHTFRRYLLFITD